MAKAVKELKTKYVVITSVTRDDLSDQGAEHFVKTVKAVKEYSPETIVEVLIPDFNSDNDLLKKIVSSGAAIIGHNIEMPEVLYSSIRPRSNYKRSLDVLEKLGKFQDKGYRVITKSSLIIGLGESVQDLYQTLDDLKKAGTDIVYLGQYLSPSKMHVPVKKYYTPEEFRGLKFYAEELGFKAVKSSPMVRSSYRAYEAYLRASGQKV